MATTIVTEAGLHGATAQPHLPGHYLNWGAIIAGALCAAAISLVLFTFGSAIGLSAVSPWPGVGLSSTVALIIAAIWAALVQVIGFASGGYVAGRVRNSWGSVVPHERRFRDGMHGLIVWAVGLLIGAAFAASAAGNVLRAGTQATATVAAGAARRLRLRLSHAATDTDGCHRHAAAGGDASRNGRRAGRPAAADDLASAQCARAAAFRRAHLRRRPAGRQPARA